MTTIVLLRHGETDWNADRRIQGWAPVPLNDRGRTQAASAGEHLAALAEFDRVVASDLRRTRETAALVCEHLEPAPVFERAWRERDFGVYQGLTYETMFSEYPEFDTGRSGRAGFFPGEARVQNPPSRRGSWFFPSFKNKTKKQFK